MARFDFIGLVVADMATSLRFYRLLGLDIPAEADTEGHVELVLSGGMKLAWDTVEGIRSFDADWQQPAGGNRISLAFSCDTPAGVDDLYRELVAAGYRGHREPWDAFWGQRYASVDDPDGSTVDLYATLVR
jgi:uncharacterized glyoxalase superfamily protein PhnB